MSTDSEIIARSIDLPAAFGELFDRHARKVGAFAGRAVGVEAAEDILSETFLIAFRKRGTYDQTVVSAVPWLLGIAARLIRKRRATEAKHWRSIAAAALREDHHDAGGIDDASSRVDAERAAHGLLARLADLPRRDRETLLLFACEELSYAEVADALGVPIGTVKSRLNRVRATLTTSVPQPRAAIPQMEGR